MQPEFVNKRRSALLRALSAVAEAERAGRTISARDMAVAAGLADTHGPGLRRSLVDAGWLETVRIAGGGQGARSALTAAGWAQIGGRPARGARRRRCLGCGELFPSEGPHHRLCDRCRSSEAWRGGDGDDYRLTLPAAS